MKRVLFLFLTICVANISHSENGPTKKKKNQVIVRKQKNKTDITKIVDNEPHQIKYKVRIDINTGKKDTIVSIEYF
jgi:hypothetical protein